MKPSALDITAKCVKCQTDTHGRLHFDVRMQLVDTDGGMAFADGWTCHKCLGQPWASSDSVVQL